METGPNAAAIGENTASSITQDELDRLTTDIVAALKTVYDPEIPSDIYEIGLIYRIDMDDNRMVDMQLSNDKLVDRGTRMVMDATGKEYSEAQELLLEHGSVRAAVDSVR